MIDVSKLKYRLIVLLETGERLDITNVCEDITWEEQEKELSVHISFSAYNTRTQEGRWISELIRPKCHLFVLSNYSGSWEETASGILNVWQPKETNSTNTLDGEANDILYDLTQSHEYRYIPEGTNAENAIRTLFGDHGIEISTYDGPKVKLNKTVYKSDCIADEITDILDMAKKKGAAKCFVRANGNGVDIIPRGTNSTVYSLRADTNVANVSAKISTQNIVTRVVVMSSGDDDTKRSVEATLDGETQYGIRQKIVTRSGDTTLDEAKKTAQEELDENGKPEETYKLSDLPDVPPLRKGDKIKIHAGALDGFYYVKSVIHYASSRTMTVEVEIADDITDGSGGTEFEKGDSVILNGAVYADSYGSGKGMTFTNHADTITIKVSTDRACPYHIGSLGWVYPNSITKA